MRWMRWFGILILVMRSGENMLATMASVLAIRNTVERWSLHDIITNLN